MSKSADAFRTISEVADWLEIQAHVLRFWESKFTQVKPIKRAGGRRYYRPNDMLLLGGIKRLLHEDGLTIKGVQKILREEGMNHVASLSEPLDDLDQAGLTTDAHDTIDMAEATRESAATPPRENVVLPFDAPRPAAADQENAPGQDQSPEPVAPAPQDPAPLATPDAPPAEQTAPSAQTDAVKGTEPTVPAAEDTPKVDQAQDDPSSKEPAPEDAPAPNRAPASEPDDKAAADIEAEPQPETAPEDPEEQREELPTFLRQPMSQPDPRPSDNTPSPEATETPAPAPPKPSIVDLPPFVAEADIPAAPSALSAATLCTTLTASQVRNVAPLLARLAALRESMSSTPRPAAKD